MPVHSTCFRPVTEQSTRICPFRIFTSLLRPELIEDEALRREAMEILERRRIFTPRCEHLIEIAEDHGGLSEAQAMEFVHEATNSAISPCWRRTHRIASAPDDERNSRLTPFSSVA